MTAYKIVTANGAELLLQIIVEIVPVALPVSNHVLRIVMVIGVVLPFSIIVANVF